MTLIDIIVCIFAGLNFLVTIFVLINNRTSNRSTYIETEKFKNFELTLNKDRDIEVKKVAGALEVKTENISKELAVKTEKISKELSDRTEKIFTRFETKIDNITVEIVKVVERISSVNTEISLLKDRVDRLSGTVDTHGHDLYNLKEQFDKSNRNI
jgi:hypothetical protein